MVRCEDFYKKWEGNPNWCEKCDETVRRIELYVDLVKEHPPIGGISEGATRPLFRIKDPAIKERAISHIEKFMSHNGRNGRVPKCTTKDVEGIIDDAEVELRNERTYGSIAESGQDEVDEIISQPTEDELNEQIQTEDDRIRALPEPSALVISTVTQAELDNYFEVMGKIAFDSEIDMYSKRVQMMIANGTLRIVSVDETGCDKND